MHHDHADIAIIGAGAAGLMSAIAAARVARASDQRAPLRIVALDGARTLGAKILVAGGGRCNVTHHHVDESAYAGSSRHAIKQVLRAFDVPRTIAFFLELGVHLKEEPTGKLFPVSDSARTVLSALLQECARLSVEVRYPWRVQRVRLRPGGGFIVQRAGPNEPAAIAARRVILCTGGKSLPKSGSDGQGYEIACALGHSITPQVFPALVPIVLADGHFIRELAGITFEATLDVRGPTGKRLASFTGSALCTHFGLSGPVVLDISRYYAAARLEHEQPPALLLNFLPPMQVPEFDALLLAWGGRPPLAMLRERLPERLALAILAHAHIDARAPASALTRDERRALARSACELALPVAGDRGFTYAEVTAGGVPLSEVRLSSMESRATPGLHLAGEICDVDGRIGGFNFQWAWASGHVAGSAAAAALLTGREG